MRTGDPSFEECPIEQTENFVWHLQVAEVMWTPNGAGKGMFQRPPTSGCVLGCFTALTRACCLRVCLYICIYPTFGAMGSARNDKLETGEENAIGCVLHFEEPDFRQCAGKHIKQKTSRKGQTMEDFVEAKEKFLMLDLRGSCLYVCVTRHNTCSDLLKEMGHLKSAGKSNVGLTWLHLSELPNCLLFLCHSCLVLLWDGGE